MKALLLAHGTRGDVEPFVALARGLVGAGHEVRLACSAELEKTVTSTGAEHFPLQGISTGWVTSDVFRRAYDTNYHALWNPRFALEFRGFYRNLITSVLDDYLAASDDGADVVLHSPIQQGQQIAERLGVPSIAVCLGPFWAPTSSFPNAGFPVRVPRRLNRATYPWSTFLREIFVGSTRKWRQKKLGLSWRPHYNNPLRQADGRATSILQPVSRHVLPPNLDYPSWVHNTGFWSASPPENWDPPQRLVEFLDHDPAPIYIWFGSIVGSDPSKTARIIVDAVKRLGVRAVVARGGSGIAFPEEKDPSIYYVEQVPFKWLFPRVSAVVHHGGMGTASLALEAGRPQVVCPFVFVHRHTAERMYEIGVSTPPVLQSKMSVDRLSKAISEVLDRNSYADRSATLQKLIAEEDGIAEAVRVLEQIGERGL